MKNKWLTISGNFRNIYKLKSFYITRKLTLYTHPLQKNYKVIKHIFTLKKSTHNNTNFFQNFDKMVE